MPPAMDAALAALLQCPRCAGPLSPAGKSLGCRACQVDFPDLGGIPCLLPEPQRAIGDWRREAQRFVELVDSQLAAFDKELARTDLLPSTRQRLQTQRQANRTNGDRVATLFSEAGVAPDSRAKASGRDFTMVQYYEQILRDWGNWGPADRPAENQVALQVVLDTLAGDTNLATDLGRLLVLGAGPSRLAYDLHQKLAPTLTVALDYDPLLLLAAQRVMFGGGITLTEFPSDPVGQDDRRGRTPAARAARNARALPPHRRRRVQGAAAARVLRHRGHAVVHRHRPGGHPRDPVARLQPAGAGGALAELRAAQLPHRAPPRAALHPAGGAGADRPRRIRRWPQAPRRTPIEYLHSRSNARWKVIDAFTFAGRKRAVEAGSTEVSGDAPPAWLLFSHVPVPPFAQAAGYQPDHPMLGYLMKLLDGKRTSADLAASFVSEHGAKPEAALDGVRAMLALIIKAIKENKAK